MEKTIKPGSWRAWMAAIRPKTFGIAVSPVLVGITLAISETDSWEPLLALLTILVAVSIQGLSNMQNDVGYTKRKAEVGNRRGLPRATSEGWLTVRQVDIAVRATAAALVVAIALIAWKGGWPVFVIGVLSVAAGYLYMGGRKPIAYTPWGELTVFLFYGIAAVVGTYLLQTGTVSSVSVIAGCACGSIGACVLAVNNWRDVEHDASIGRRTLAVVLGRKRFARLYVYMVLLPFALVLAVVTADPSRFPYLLALLPILGVKRLIHDFNEKRDCELNETLFGNVKLEVRFALLLSAGALVDSAINWLL